MRIQLHDNIESSGSYHCNNPERTLKAGEWLEVDTNDLRGNQFVCFVPDDETRKGRFYIGDNYVTRVEDDERFNTGWCGYCNKYFHASTHEERLQLFEQHCQEEEALICPEEGPYNSKCFWNSPKVLEQKEERTDLGNGEWEKVTRVRMMNGCRYDYSFGKIDTKIRCEHQAHRLMGMQEFDRKKNALMSLLYRPYVWDITESSLDVGKPYRLFVDHFHDCYQLVSNRVYMEFLYDPLGNQIWVIDHGTLSRYCDTNYKISERVLERVKKLLRAVYNDPANIEKIVEKYA